MSRTDTPKATDDKVQTAVELIRSLNEKAAVITTPIEQLSGAKILDTMEHNRSLEKELMEEEACPVCGGHHREHHHHDHEECGCGHEHHHHDHEECGCGHEHHHHDHEECGCGHEHHHHEHHHHDHEECGCGHEHHHHDHEECGCGHEHHHHDHEECGCGHEHHHHDREECGCGHDHHHEGHEHHHHHADEVFTSWGKETIKSYTQEEISKILDTLSTDDSYGMILRAKGMVEGKDGQWIYFDMVPPRRMWLWS